MSDDIFNQIGKIIVKKGCSGVSKDAAEWISFLSNTEKKALLPQNQSIEKPAFAANNSQTPPYVKQIVQELPKEQPNCQQPVRINASDISTLLQSVMGCRMCKLAETRKNIVFGEGNPHARLMFIGEAPGADEDETGRPFVGRAGQLLDKMITAMQFSRAEVYIANILKCRPPFNRNPEPAEAACCMPYLEEQIKLVNPECIVLLGAVATRFLLKHEGSIGKIRGTWQNYKDIPVMVTYHTSFLLRTESAKKDAWQDLQKVMAKFGKFHKK